MELLEAALLRGGGYLLPLPTLWTCLALLAALFVVLLRSRAVTGSTEEVLRAPQRPPATDTSAPKTDVAPPDVTAAMGVCRKEVLFVGSCGDNDVRDDDDDDDGNHEDCWGHDDQDHDGCYRDDVGGMGVMMEGWKGDLRWYLYQDMAAIDGSVVRLWEDERRRLVTTPPRKRLRGVESICVISDAKY